MGKPNVWARGVFSGIFVPLALVLLLAACDSVEERVAKHYARGQELMEEGEPGKALLEFRNVLQLNDQHAPSHFAIGLILEQKGELQAAFARFRTVSEIDPTNFQARLKLARYYLLAGATDKAEEEMVELLKLDPNRADVQILNASLLLRKGDLRATRKALDLALILDPGNADAALVETAYLMQTATPAAALARIDEALKKNEDNLSLHLTKLQILEKEGDQTGVGAQLTTMIETFPEELNFRKARAQWAMRAGDIAVGEADLRALVEAQPENLEAVGNLIRFLRQQEGDEAARAELAALAAKPTASFELELLLAQFDVETGHKAQAIANLRNLIEGSGENAQRSRLVLAKLLLSEGEIDEAQALVEVVLKQDPTNVEALVLKIARLIDENRLEEAAQDIRTGLNEAPDDVRLLLLSGRANELSGNVDIANDRFAKAIRASEYKPETVQIYIQFLNRTGRMRAAETVLSEAVAQNPGQAKLYDLLGFIRVRLNDWPGANQAAADLEKLDPERARQLRAAILIGQEEFDEGISLLRELPDDESRQAASVAAIAQSYVREGKIEEAEAFLDDLLAKDPENVHALGIRGNLYAATGNFGEAEEKYRAILAIEPSNGSAYSALARLFAMQGDTAASEEQIVRGLEASPDSLILLSRLAELQEQRGQFDEAISTYEKLYRLVPDSVVVANNLASLLSDHRADNPADVERAYQIAGRLRDLDLPQYRDTYGWTRYLKGEYKQALEAIAPVAEALPDNPWVLYHLGMVLEALGDPEKARKALEASLEKTAGSSFPPAEAIRATIGSLKGQ